MYSLKNDLLVNLRLKVCFPGNPTWDKEAVLRTRQSGHPFVSRGQAVMKGGIVYTTIYHRPYSLTILRAMRVHKSVYATNVCNETRVVKEHLGEGGGRDDRGHKKKKVSLGKRSLFSSGNR